MSTLFSTSCLIPATRLILIPWTPSYVRSEIEQLIAEFVFSDEVLFPVSGSGIKSTKPTSADLKLLVEPLRLQKESLPQIFKIGITSQARKRKPDSDIVEAIFNSITVGAQVIEPLTGAIAESDAEILIKIMGVLVETGTMVTSETFATLIDGVSKLSDIHQVPVRWDIVEVALKLDFDVFLGRGNEIRLSRLIGALNRDKQDQGRPIKVVQLLIDSFVKARDLEGFVKIWAQELSKQEARGGIWESDEVANLFAGRMEEALLAAQIDNILRIAYQEESWVVIDAVLRGVRREDTEDKIRTSLLRIPEILSNGDAGWRGWRALVRALQIEKSLARDIQATVLKAMKKSATGATGDQAKETLFAGEVLMEGADISGQTEALEVAVGAMKDAQKGWNGCFADVNGENLGVAMVIGFTARWLGVVELVSSNARTRFADEFLNMAMGRTIEEGNKDIIGRTAWYGMLGRDLFYEYPALKG